MHLIIFKVFTLPRKIVINIISRFALKFKMNLSIELIFPNHVGYNYFTSKGQG